MDGICIDSDRDIILEVDHLVTSFATESGRVRAVDNISFRLRKGTVLGVVGESGCGKSVTALSIMRLLPQPAGRIESGAVRLGGVDLAALPAKRMPQVRGNRIAMIFQEPMTALNPVQRIWRQLTEVFVLHRPGMSAAQRRSAAIELLRRVGIPEAPARMTEYPHQLSGGMRQRVMIAMALAAGPDVLIADEPTTALDVTIQAQIVDLILDLQRERHMAVIFITHDLGVIAETAQEVLVMYAGQVVESAPVESLFRHPGHPYTQGLLRSMPQLSSRPKSRLPAIEGTVPGLAALPSGCRFRNRCPQATDLCRRQNPVPKVLGPAHWARCHALS